MSYDHGPCYFCNKKSCKNCPSAVAKVVGDTYFTSPWVFEIEKEERTTTNSLNVFGKKI